jgi:hypothetical protein
MHCTCPKSPDPIDAAPPSPPTQHRHHDLTVSAMYGDEHTRRASPLSLRHGAAPPPSFLARQAPDVAPHATSSSSAVSSSARSGEAHRFGRRPPKRAVIHSRGRRHPICVLPLCFNFDPVYVQKLDWIYDFVWTSSDLEDSQWFLQVSFQIQWTHWFLDTYINICIATEFIIICFLYETSCFFRDPV